MNKRKIKKFQNIFPEIGEPTEILERIAKKTGSSCYAHIPSKHFGSIVIVEIETFDGEFLRYVTGSNTKAMVRLPGIVLGLKCKIKIFPKKNFERTGLDKLNIKIN